MPKLRNAPDLLDPARNVLEVITSSLPTLRRSDRKVGELVLADPDALVGATLAETARRAEVSEPTVIRFCEAIGCEGYQAFKLRLAQSMTLGMPATLSVLTAGDSPQVLADKVFDYTMNSLDRARRQLDHRALAQAIDVLEKASRIDFFGFGASGIVAQDAQQKFPLFGVPCSAHADAHQQFITAAMMKPGDVAVAISNTGHTVAILEAVEVALKNGATVIGISGHRSPLIERCHIGLICETLENTDLYTPTISRLAALVLIDILATAVAFRRDDVHHAQLARMKQGLADMRAGHLHDTKRRGDHQPRTVWHDGSQHAAKDGGEHFPPSQQPKT